jgi:hypothetical protein
MKPEPHRIPIDEVVPGGIQPGDHIHTVGYDNSCSRCRRAIAEGEVPLMLWSNKTSGDDMRLLIYCEDCLQPRH